MSHSRSLLVKHMVFSIELTEIICALKIALNQFKYSKSSLLPNVPKSLPQLCLTITYNCSMFVVLILDI